MDNEHSCPVGRAHTDLPVRRKLQKPERPPRSGHHARCRKEGRTCQKRKRKVQLSASDVSCARFSLTAFERKLRSILGVSAERLVGAPGTDGRDITGLEPREASKVYLLDQIMVKFDDGVSSDRKVSAAIEKWKLAEDICKDRNHFFASTEPFHNERLMRAREYMYTLLGPRVDLKRLSCSFGFGPGASTRLGRRYGDACYKYSGTPEVTPNAYSAGQAAVACNPHWQSVVGYLPGGTPSVTWGSKLTTVPKNYKIDRVIAIEPDLNMYLQKGLGSLIRQKLKRRGINLDDQSRNRFAAADLTLATIDFSMASDSVSQGLAWFMSPPDWSEWFDRTRSDFTVTLEGELHRLQKLSSMGNGYTFEFETAVFYCLALACVEPKDHHRIAVYGDDVIIPVEAVSDYLSLCQLAGFTPNAEKSFWSGPFRESCGIHYHTQYDVTPFYVRRPVLTLDQLFLLHNNLKRWVSRLDSLLTREEWLGLTALLGWVRSFAPKWLRKPRIPDGFGDGAFIGSFAECSPRVHGDGWEYFVVEVVAYKAKKRRTKVPGLLVKSMTNLHKRRRLLPEIWESILTAYPSSSDSDEPPTLLVRQLVPWSAWG